MRDMLYIRHRIYKRKMKNNMRHIKQAGAVPAYFMGRIIILQVIEQNVLNGINSSTSFVL